MLFTFTTFIVILSVDLILINKNQLFNDIIKGWLHSENCLYSFLLSPVEATGACADINDIKEVYQKQHYYVVSFSYIIVFFL